MLLARHAVVDSRDTEGLTPFMRACDNLGLALVQRRHYHTFPAMSDWATTHLLEAGADINAATPDGTTSLEAAVAAEQFDLARYLL